MKNFLIGVVLLLFLAVPAKSETVIYDDSPERALLQNMPTWSGAGAWNNSLYPGTRENPVANDNIVIVDFTTGLVANPNFVIGGLSELGDAENNIVYVVMGTVDRAVYGGLSKEGSSLNNRVTVEDNADIYIRIVAGGEALGSGNSNYNTTIVKNGTMLQVYGGISAYGTSDYNRVFFDDGLTEGIAGGISRDGSANNNKIKMIGGFATNVVGGQAHGGDANNNEVFISGGTINDPNNEYSVILGGWSSNDGDANNNVVHISGGNITSTMIIGGDASEAYKNANYNQVIITGGVIEAIIFAGRADYWNSPEKAKYNSITLSGNPDLSKSFLRGNNNYSDFHRDGNTLNVDGFMGSVSGIYAFQNYNFYLPYDLKSGDSLVTVTDAYVSMSKASDGEQTIFVDIIMDSNSRPYNSGDYVYLIDAEKGIDTSGIDMTAPISASATPLVTYEWWLSQEEQKLKAELKGTPKKETDSFTAIPLASITLVRQGGEGLDSGLFQVLDDTRKNCSWIPFGFVGYGYNDYSDLRVGGFSAYVGMARRIYLINDAGSLFMGLFAEYGNGNYNTIHDAKGDLSYFGGGAVVRYDYKNMYAKLAFRFGQVNQDYRNSSFMANQLPIVFDANSIYYSANIGLGYVHKFNEKTGLDLHADAWWNMVEGINEAVAGGNVQLDDVNLFTVRAGVRLFHELLPDVVPYLGAGFIYDFDGASYGKVNNIKLNKIAIDGASGYGELGIRYEIYKTKNLNVLFDLNSAGYFGNRNGVTGQLKFKVEY